MAKNPSVPNGVSSGRITKRAAYGNFGTLTEDVGDQTGGVLEPGRPESERGPYQGEQRVPRSPGRPNDRQWATASYNNVTGRAARVADDSYSGRGHRQQGPNTWKQVPNAGDNTVSHTNNRKGRVRPDRW